MWVSAGGHASSASLCVLGGAATGFWFHPFARFGLIEPIGRDGVEGSLSIHECGLSPGECLPTPDIDIHVERIDLDREADPSDRLGSDQRGAATEKRLVGRVSRLAVIEHRPPHALDRLLSAMDRVGILAATWY